ncbi:unnamed protein product [Ilex paraguariensis]|uniref:Uncharacterized protein n=1 Tax=Ilex paraguariensis TaxID=185542 RepID=A0ABC8TQ58_9AQUA
MEEHEKQRRPVGRVGKEHQTTVAKSNHPETKVFAQRDLPTPPGRGFGEATRRLCVAMEPLLVRRFGNVTRLREKRQEIGEVTERDRLILGIFE